MIDHPATSENPQPNPNEITVQGILEIDPQSHCGRLLPLSNHGKPKPTDPFVPKELIKRLKLKTGKFLTAKAYKNNNHKNPRVHFISEIDLLPVDQRKNCPSFLNLTTIAPNKQLKLETKDGRMTNRVIDLFTPIGKGQRGLIVAPPRAGKTTLLHDIASGIKENHPECIIAVLLVDERPEEVTDFKRSIDATIFSSSNDEPLQNHIRIAELTIEYCKNLVETGKDVVLLLDSLTRLSRAYNIHSSSRGSRTMTGGLDVRALEKPRQIFSAARNTEEAGSLTIIASILVETGSKMDDLIFQEFKGTGNMELVLDRKVAELRLFPAINFAASGTRREELLLPENTLSKVHFFRRALTPLKPIEAAETLLSRLSKTSSNSQLLELINC